MRVAKEGTKTRFIDAALELFHTHGPHNTTFQMIADSIGVSQAALYKHFENKDALIEACCRYAADLGRDFIRAEIPEDKAADAQLKSYIAANLKWASRQRKESGALLAFHYYAVSNPLVRKLDEEVNERRQETIANFVASGVRERLWQAKYPKVVAHNLQSYLIGEMIRTYTWPKEFTMEERVERAWSVARSLIN